MAKAVNVYSIGESIENRFKIERIHEGGMGIVYVCNDRKEDVMCALKTFKWDPEITSDELITKRNIFKKEALNWLYLEKHPFLVKTYGLTELDSQPYIIMEYIPPDAEGRNTLTPYLSSSVSLEQALTWAIQFCHGMEYAFSKGVSPHSDIKPDNILIAPDRTLKITDFGISRLKRSFIEKDFGRQGNSIEGTYAYMAPEQFDGIANEKADIYSFGIVLYQMAAQEGKHPFDYDSSSDKRDGNYWRFVHKNDPVPFIDSPLLPIIRLCLQKEPEERYVNFQDMRSDLEALWKEHIKNEDGSNKPLPALPGDLALEIHDLVNQSFSYLRLGLYEKALEIANKTIAKDECNSSYLAFYCRGMAHAYCKDFQRAFDDFDRAIHLAPGMVAAALLNDIGVVYLIFIGNDSKAIECFSKAIELDHQFAKAYHNRGHAYKMMEQHENAIRDLETAISLNKKNDKAYITLGMIWFLRREHDKARKYLSAAIKINPFMANPYTVRGNTYADEGDKERAMADFTKAIEIEPDCADTHICMGSIFEEMGKYEKAIESYSEAIRLDSENILAHNYRGCTYQKMGDLCKAEEDNAKIKEIMQNLLRERRGDYWRVIDQLSMLIENAKLSVEGIVCSLNNRGLAYELTEDYDKALHDYAQAIQLIEDHKLNIAEPYHNAGSLFLEKMGDTDKAIACYTIALEKQGAEKHFDTYRCRGRAYAEAGQYKEAYEDFAEAAKINPQSAEVFYDQGTLYDLLNIFPEAIKSYSRSIYIKPDFVKAWNNRGACYLKLGEYEKALDDYNKTVQLNPSLDIIYVNRGLLYLALNRRIDALNDFERAVVLNPDFEASVLQIMQNYQG